MHLGESVSVFMVMVDLQAAEGVGGILYAGNSLDLVKKKSPEVFSDNFLH